MRRKLFTACCVLSLVLAILLAALAIRSYWIDEFLGWETRDFSGNVLNRKIYGIDLADGGILLKHDHEHFPALTAEMLNTFRGIYPTRTETFRWHEAVRYPQLYGPTGSVPNVLGCNPDST